MEPKQVAELSIDELQANPLQPRGVITPESLVDLVDSIKEHGIIEPLVVAKTPAGYQIVAGERRWRAAKLAGLATVPAVIKETTPRGMLEMALVENVQRTDLNAVDRAKAFERLMSEFGLSNGEVAQRIGKSSSYISNTLRLLQLPDALKDGLLSGLISEGHARALSAIEDPALVVEAYKIVLRESASVRRAEELARKMKARSGQKPKEQAAEEEMLILREDLEKMGEEIEKALLGLGPRENGVSVKIAQSRRETRVHLKLKGSPDEVERQLEAIHRGITSY